MMNTRQSYNSWAAQYDTNQNKTRDLEAVALRSSLAKIRFDSCLEIGCGTGKNTEWLVQNAKRVLAVDLSEKMLAKAKEKVISDRVEFKQANILDSWTFKMGTFELVTFSLVLEHIENLEPIFIRASDALIEGGYVYVGELHPFKQYTGSKARFETDEGTHVVECFNHHISDFINAAKNCQLSLVRLDEYFDDDDRTTIPRIVSIIFKKL